MTTEVDEINASSPLMTLQQIKACGHLLLGCLNLRWEKQGTDVDPREESIIARVYVKKRLKDLPLCDDKNDKNYVLRELYKILDLNHAAIFSKIGQVPGELAFLSSIYDTPEFDDVEKQFIWTCDYLLTSQQLESEWRGNFIVPNTPEFQMPIVDDLEEEEKARFEQEKEIELRRQLEGYLALENRKNTE